jgi:acetyltransferase-like isoleucine patch superfamily enzyme
MKDVFVHPTATVEKGARIGRGTKVWHYAHVREGASIGDDCILGHCAFVDTDVSIGSRVKIGNKASVFQGVTVEDEAFIGPHVAFTNDMRPRSIGEWRIVKTKVGRGASIGANSTIVCGIVIGSHAMVGAGSVVTSDVPSHGLVYGNPAKLRGFVCRCGQDMKVKAQKAGTVSLICGKCGEELEMPEKSYKMLQGI